MNAALHGAVPLLAVTDRIHRGSPSLTDATAVTDKQQYDVTDRYPQMHRGSPNLADTFAVTEKQRHHNDRTRA